MAGGELKPISWSDGKLRLLDQCLLPSEIIYRECVSAADVAGAIRRMVVRGAPAIGISAAFGMALEARRLAGNTGRERLLAALREAGAILRGARPTAVNLAWAVARIERRLAERAGGLSGQEIAEVLEEEALALLNEDLATNRLIGRHGSELVPCGAAILTHCNAGALATGGYGTALGVVRAAFEQGKSISVFAGETRPFLQGARLTALELTMAGIPVTLITDSCAGSLMAAGKISLVLVGADRIAANGDTANKVGTYSLAVLARYHGIPIYIAAPLSTIDLELPAGSAITIEEREKEEITFFMGRPVAPRGAAAYNPAFDVTPAGLISALITERGIIHNPDPDKIRALFHQSG